MSLLASSISTSSDPRARLCQAWALLGAADAPLVPAPRARKRRLASHQRLKACVITCYAAEWSHLGREVSPAVVREEFEMKDAARAGEARLH